MLASLICGPIFLTLYKTARCYLSEPAALVIASVSVFGSVLVSTLGAALWNANFAVLFIQLLPVYYSLERSPSLWENVISITCGYRKREKRTSPH